MLPRSEEEYEILRRLRAGERIDHFETVRVTSAGECIDVSLTISPLRDPAGKIIGCYKIARDITKAKQAEAALRQSEQRLTREVAGAKTLQSISTRLIHDISQRITLLGLHLGILKHGLPASATDLEQEIGEMYPQIGDLASDIQALSHGLHPARLELLGLKAAVARLRGELSNRHDVTIEVHFENIPEALPPEISLCLYRVLQEALQNVLEHSVSRDTPTSR